MDEIWLAPGFEVSTKQDLTVQKRGGRDRQRQHEQVSWERDKYNVLEETRLSTSEAKESDGNSLTVGLPVWRKELKGKELKVFGIDTWD